MSASLKLTRVAELDLLRFLAALSVVFYHRANTGLFGPVIGDVTRFGFLGVHLFFMISGFVILWTAMNKTTWEFAASRFSRLYPSFWICLTITVVLMTLAHGSFSGRELVANATMSPTTFRQPLVDPVYWTLRVELKFYALILLALMFGQIYNIERWLMGWLAASVVAALPVAPLWIQYVSLDTNSTFFIGGCYLYLIRARGVSALRVAMLGISLALAIVVAVHSQETFNLHPDRSMEVGVAAVILIEYAVFFAVATRAWQLPPSPLWYWLGGMTYPLYLLHREAGSVVWAWLPRGMSNALRLGIVVGLALLVSWALAATVERRGCHALYKLLTGEKKQPLAKAAEVAR